MSWNLPWGRQLISFQHPVTSTVNPKSHNNYGFETQEQTSALIPRNSELVHASKFCSHSVTDLQSYTTPDHRIELLIQYASFGTACGWGLKFRHNYS